MENYKEMLELAIKKRILDEINSRKEAAQIINNFQGGGSVPLASESRSPNSLQEAMFDPGNFDYFVDIERDDRFNEEGKRVGWDKRVKRYRKPNA